MTATLTPSATAADLLDELRQLLGRHDGASTLDEVVNLADELGAVLRRTRGRIQTLARRERPMPKPAAEPKPESAPEKPEPPAAEARAAAPKTERPAPPDRPPRPTFAAPLPRPRPVVIEIRPDKPTPDPAPAVRPVETPPATLRRHRVPAVVRLVLAVLVSLWAAVCPAAKPARRGVRAVRRAASRGLAAVRPYARRVRAAARRELDRWLS